MEQLSYIKWYIKLHKQIGANYAELGFMVQAPECKVRFYKGDYVRLVYMTYYTFKTIPVFVWQKKSHIYRGWLEGMYIWVKYSFNLRHKM